MPTNNGRRGGKPKKARGGLRSRGGDAAAGRRNIDMGMAGSSSDDHLVISDINYRPPSGVYNATPPRSLNNQIYFCRQEYATTVTTNTTTITEANYSFTAQNNMGQVGSFLAIFDQYFLDSVVFTISNVSSNTGVSSLPQVYTAIDFDSAANVGIATIVNFSTCNVTVLGSGKSLTRIIRPCLQGSASGNTAALVARTWVDSAYSGVGFYGLRTIINNTPAAAVLLDVSYSCIWAFRNNI